MKDNVRSFVLLNADNMDKKAAIGRKAASLIDYLITDPGIDPKHLDLFRENEVEVILAT
jgi:hypothetical protein